jgi:hypothetical protein
MRDKATLYAEEHHEKADEQAARSNGTVFQWTHFVQRIRIGGPNIFTPKIPAKDSPR